MADDSESNQLLVVRLLEKRGYRVDVVSNGSEALAQQPYDLLFLDCFMPDMNGFETTRRIRSSEPTDTDHRVDRKCVAGGSSEVPGCWDGRLRCEADQPRRFVCCSRAVAACLLDERVGFCGVSSFRFDLGISAIRNEQLET